MAYFKTKDGKATVEHHTNTDPGQLVEIQQKEYRALTETITGAKAKENAVRELLIGSGVTDPEKQDILLKLLGGKHG